MAYSAGIRKISPIVKTIIDNKKLRKLKDSQNPTIPAANMMVPIEIECKGDFFSMYLDMGMLKTMMTSEWEDHKIPKNFSPCLKSS